MIFIRKAQPQDLSNIKHILQRVGLSPDIEDFMDNFMVVELDGSVVGTAGLEAYQDVAVLRSVAILPEYQHQGLGDGLVRAVINFSDRRNVEKLFLFTNTAKGFFEKLGFKVVPRKDLDSKCKISSQYNCCPVSCDVMELNVKEFFNNIHCNL